MLLRAACSDRSSDCSASLSILSLATCSQPRVKVAASYELKLGDVENFLPVYSIAKISQYISI